MKICFIVFLIFFASFSNRKQKLPICVHMNKNVSTDSITDFVKVYLQSKKMDVINFDLAMQLQNVAIEQATLEYYKGVDEVSATDYDRILKGVGPLVNSIFINLKSDSISQTIDSIYWNVNYLPFDTERQPIKHSFVPQNKSVYHALKEMCDSIIASKDVL